MTRLAYCAECGAKVNPWGECSISADHDTLTGGFHCPECGTELDANEREGSSCLACRTGDAA